MKPPKVQKIQIVENLNPVVFNWLSADPSCDDSIEKQTIYLPTALKSTCKRGQ